MALSLLGCGASGLTPAGPALPEGSAGAEGVVLGPQGAQVSLAVPIRFSEGRSTQEIKGLPPGLEIGPLSIEGIPDLMRVRVRPHAADTAGLLAEAHGGQVLVETQPGASPRPVQVGGHPERPLYKMDDRWYPELPGRLVLPALPAAAEGTTVVIDRKPGASPWQGTAVLRFLDTRSHWRPDLRISLDRDARSASVEAWVVVHWTAGGYGRAVDLSLVVQPNRPLPIWHGLRSLAAEAADAALQPEGSLWRWQSPAKVDTSALGGLRLLLGKRSPVPTTLEHRFRFPVPWDPWQDETPRRAPLELTVGHLGGMGMNCPPGTWQTSQQDETGQPMPLALGEAGCTPADRPLVLWLGESLDTMATLVQRTCQDNALGQRETGVVITMTHSGRTQA
jgi:hypothetical protein